MIKIVKTSVCKFEKAALARDGVAAIEFALILPILILLLLVGSEVILYVKASRKVVEVARSISQMISQASPPPNSSTAIVYAQDLHFAYDSALVIFPYVMKDAKRQNISWWNDVNINFSSIQFTPNQSSPCSNPSDQSTCYTANVVWTTPQLSSNYRPCNTPQLPADNAAPSSPTTLPRSVFGPASLIVIDVIFTYKPSFGSAFIPAMKIVRSSYVQPRYATLINLDPNNGDPIAVKCPGY